MENNSYNSLTEKLIQNGILPSDENDCKDNIFENHFKKRDADSNNDSEPEENKDVVQKPKKRINQYDLDMIRYDDVDQAISETINFKMTASLKVLNRFLNLKKNKLNKKTPASIEDFFFRMFPKLYNAKLVKDAVAKLLELDVDTKTLLDKTIPYGEGETRYDDLIKYLSYANQIQKKLKKEQTN